MRKFLCLILSSIFLIGCVNPGGKQQIPFSFEIFGGNTNVFHYPNNKKQQEISTKALPPTVWLEAARAIMEAMAKIFMYAYDARKYGSVNEYYIGCNEFWILRFRWGEDPMIKRLQLLKDIYQLYLEHFPKVGGQTEMPDVIAPLDNIVKTIKNS
jgi:hypothetical protein